MRRSRCVYVAAVTVLVYVIIFSVLSYESTVRPLFSATFMELNLDFSGLRSIFESQDSYSFDTWADAIFRKKLHDGKTDATLKMAKYAVDGPESTTDTVGLPSFLTKEDVNPHVFPHEPRLTLGILLGDLNAQIEANAGVDDLQIRSFHWADWTDISLLDKKMLSIGDSQLTCELLEPQKLELNSRQKDLSVDSKKYCFNDADIMVLLAKHAKNPALGPYLKKITEQPFKTGLHVYRCPKRASQRIRKLAAVSYLHDFMPAPMAVHFLIPTAPQQVSPLHVHVNQDAANRIRLLDTPTAASVAKKGATLDLRKELASIAAKMAPERLLPSYAREIPHDDFVDKSQDIVDLLTQKGDLSPQDTLYLDSLKYSLSTDKPTKYFYEALLVSSERQWASGGHYDWRFFKGLKTHADIHLPLLHGLISAWLRFTNANGITTWIAHGSLLGWYWNGLSFPWDADYDVQVPISDLHKLSRRYNQTVVVDFGADEKEVRLGRYFLDCGTWISHRDPGNGHNNIDARFIDMDSGLYIDITALAVSQTPAPARYDKGLPKQLQRPEKYMNLPPNPKAELARNTATQLYNCRNKHFSSLSEISPLRLTVMEGVPAYIPNNFTEILQAEYGSKGIGAQKFRQYAFLPRLRLWANARLIAKYTREKKADAQNVKLGSHAKTASEIVDTLSIFTFSDQDYLELMAAEKDLLFEYLVSKDKTALHQQEMELLLQGKSTEEILLKDSEFGPQLKELRPDVSKYLAVRTGKSYTQKMDEYVEMYQAFKEGKELASREEDKEPETLQEERNAVRMQTFQEANDPRRTRPDPLANILGF
ncbi:hypothetical protein OXX59_005022 [Metschnikowia pulcherrima]